MPAGYNLITRESRGFFSGGILGVTVFITMFGVEWSQESILFHSVGRPRMERSAGQAGIEKYMYPNR